MHALLIVDMQKDFVKRLSAETLEAIVRGQNELMRVFAQHKLPIFFVITEHSPDGSDALKKAREENDVPAAKDSPGAQFVDGLVVPPSATIVKKKKYSVFFEPETRRMVESFAGTIVIAGVNTHACVRTLAVDANQREQDVIIAVDAIASYDPGYHQESLRYLGARIGRVLTNDAIIREVARQP
jgi:nicotinamidase-related amidase